LPVGLLGQPLPPLLAPSLVRLMDAEANVRIQIAPFGEFETESGNLVRQFRRRPENCLIRRLVGNIIPLRVQRLNFPANRHSKLGCLLPP
jgi:hypothetical protein